MKIDKDIPIPTRGSRNSKHLSLFESMDTGDSVYFKKPLSAIKFKQAVYRKLGSNLVTIRKTENGARVWKINTPKQS